MKTKPKVGRVVFSADEQFGDYYLITNVDQYGYVTFDRIFRNNSIYDLVNWIGPIRFQDDLKRGNIKIL